MSQFGDAPGRRAGGHQPAAAAAAAADHAALRGLALAQRRGLRVSGCPVETASQILTYVENHPTSFMNKYGVVLGPSKSALIPH